MNWTLILTISSIAVAVMITVISLISYFRMNRRKHMRDYERMLIRRQYNEDPERMQHTTYYKDYPSNLNALEKRRFYPGELLNWTETKDIEKSIYEKKKDKFLNIANISFHFADKERIKAFYNDYFKEPTLKDLIRETISETNADVKGSIPSIIESKIGSKDLSKWISTIKLPDVTETGMFKRYQSETIKKDQVRLGLEEDDIELSVLSDFEAKVSNISKEFEYNFDIGSLDRQRTLLKEKAAERTLANLEKASGWVIIEGNFLIQKEKNEFYKITMKHPVSNYLASGKEICISCLIPINQVEPSVSGNYSNSIDKFIPLTIYGQVWQPVNRQSNILELIITPLAIY